MAARMVVPDGARRGAVHARRVNVPPWIACCLLESEREGDAREMCVSMHYRDAPVHENRDRVIERQVIGSMAWIGSIDRAPRGGDEARHMDETGQRDERTLARCDLRVECARLTEN